MFRLCSDTKIADGFARKKINLAKLHMLGACHADIHNVADMSDRSLCKNGLSG